MQMINLPLSNQNYGHWLQNDLKLDRESVQEILFLILFLADITILEISMTKSHDSPLNEFQAIQQLLTVTEKKEEIRLDLK